MLNIFFSVMKNNLLMLFREIVQAIMRKFCEQNSKILMVNQIPTVL
jgi:hypothetical protein